MPFAAALSEHPDAVHAVAECVGQLLDAHGPHPDLVVVFATAAHRRSFGEVGAVTRRLLQPACMLGTLSSGIIGTAREVDEQPALAVWAGWGLGEVTGVYLDHVPGGRAGADDTIVGWERLSELVGACDAATVLLVADPLSFPADVLLDRMATAHREAVVVGGLAAAGMAPGDNTMLLDGVRHQRGAVAVVLDQRVATVVSQGCRPVGDPFTVTRASGHVLEELGSRPALTRLQELALGLEPADRELLVRGLHIGRVVDEHQLDFRRGDFLIRAVLGAQQAGGGLVVGDRLEVGDTVQFQVRDAGTAHEDLVELLAGQDAAGALVFSCNGRGTRLFPEPDHDAAAVCEITGTDAVAGLFCAGEIGPVGSRSFLHGFTASVALFRDRSDRT